jgi:hypothetical protein
VCVFNLKSALSKVEGEALVHLRVALGKLAGGELVLLLQGTGLKVA